MRTVRAPETVDFPALARELGLTRKQRADVLESGTISPVVRGKGKSTKVTQDDAERVENAARIALITGIAIVVILKLLASGTVKPTIP
jgi:hypothetical protein